MYVAQVGRTTNKPKGVHMKTESDIQYIIYAHKHTEGQNKIKSQLLLAAQTLRIKLRS